MTRDFLEDPAPRPRHYTVISVDDHLVEPPDVFSNREPARFAGRFPRVVELEQGRTYSREHVDLPPLTVEAEDRLAWLYEDRVYLQIGLNAVVGYKDHSRLRNEPSTFDEMRPGCFDIHARVRDMDIAGIWASVNFPSQITGFAGTVFSGSHDPELGQAVTRAWNDWMYEEWYGAYPERVVPLGITWLSDPAVGATEIRRNAERGFTAISFPELPHRLGYPPAHDEYWDPIIRACVDTDTVLCLHVGSSGMLPLPQDGPRFEKNVTLFPALSLMAAVEWLWSGVPARYPELKIALSEGGIGWVPMLMDRLDFMTDHAGRTADYARWVGSRTPGEVLADNFYFCSLDDPSALLMLDRIGEDHVMVEMDYPHSDTTWPDTQERLRASFARVPLLTKAQIQKLTWTNASKLFRHPPPEDPDWPMSNPEEQ
jgi:predicted TIM-barrel fold metal-dependent hydrolase